MGEYNLVTGDTSKPIKGIGELALRISRFDCYRLFTLYEDVKNRKVMDVSGDQRYYLVFRSLRKEIRIPEYDPQGFFEVDKTNGCILFKITKKNAEDILSMKTAGEKIFHIVRVFEERDEFGKVLNVTDEVEVYNGRWGDDYAFSAYSSENKIDLLTKALAAQVDKNAKLQAEYNDLFMKYNEEVTNNANLNKRITELESAIEGLELQLENLMGDEYDGTVLSRDTKYIALEDTLANVDFTEEQYRSAIDELMTKGEVELPGVSKEDEVEDSKLKLEVQCMVADCTIIIYQNDGEIGCASMGSAFAKSVYVSHGDRFDFKYSYDDESQDDDIGISSLKVSTNLSLEYIPENNDGSNAIILDDPSNIIISGNTDGETEIVDTVGAKVNIINGAGENMSIITGNIGVLRCNLFLNTVRLDR